MTNEENVEETTETNDELEENETEVVEKKSNEDESNDDSPTLEDYQKLKKERETLLAQKEHWRKKAENSKVELKPLNKSNETQSGLTREEAILYAKGYTDEEVELANKLSKVNGTNVLVAIEDEIFKGKVASRKKKEKAESASLPASHGVGKFKADKPVGEMSEEEHAKYFHKVLGN